MRLAQEKMSPRTKVPDVPPPVLRVTRYEQVSALLYAIIGGLVVAVFLLAFAWYSSRVPKPREPVPVELIEESGGAEDGSIDETLRVDSPLEANPDAGSAESQTDVPEVREALDQVVELADGAVAQT